MKKTIHILLTLILILSTVICILPAHASENIDEPSTDFELVTYHESEGIRIFSTMGNEFSEKTVVSVEKITNADKVSSLKSTLGDNANKITVYEITATENSESVHPKGTIAISFNVPENYDMEKTLLLTVSENETPQIMACRKNGGGLITTYTDTLGTYVVVETVKPITLSDFYISNTWGSESATARPDSSDDNRESTTYIWWGFGAMIAILAVGFGVVSFFKAKKKKN